jgi:hypothetical protein
VFHDDFPSPSSLLESKPPGREEEGTTGTGTTEKTATKPVARFTAVDLVGTARGADTTSFPILTLLRC